MVKRKTPTTKLKNVKVTEEVLTDLHYIKHSLALKTLCEAVEHLIKLEVKRTEKKYLWNVK